MTIVRSNDKVEKPEHYTRYKIEPITFIVENEIPYCESNVIKYVCRWQHKHPTKQVQIEDLKKARQYLDILIKKAEQG
jgi:hypothetical protein